jgi:hypothetical protein
MTTITADLSGDSWRLRAPDGSRVERDAGWPWRPRLVIPGVLEPLTVWCAIEAAREGLYGLRVVGHSGCGMSHYVTGQQYEPERPLFQGAP